LRGGGKRQQFSVKTTPNKTTGFHQRGEERTADEGKRARTQKPIIIYSIVSPRGKENITESAQKGEEGQLDEDLLTQLLEKR